MTQRYILYGSPDSANLVIRMLLHELGKPFETVWLDRSKREHKQADFLQMNPQGLIPVLVDNGQPIFETAAIVLHLCDNHGSLVPQDRTDRARFLQWLFFLSNTLHADLRARFYSDDYIEGVPERAALCRWWQLYPTTDAASPISADVLPNLHCLLSELARRPAIAAACGEENIFAPFFIGPKLPDLPMDTISD